MTIQDDVIYCNCKGCLNNCRVPGEVFGSGSTSVMRSWAQKNADGKDLLGNYPIGRLWWNSRSVGALDSDGSMQAYDYCTASCRDRTCGHDPSNPRRPHTGTYASTEDKAKKFWDGFKPAKKEPPAPRVVTPIAEMK